jgi:7-cyano-7-deazaguanine synthase
VERVAVLASGGLDSAVLVADLARSAEVTPIYVACGLVWELAERRALEAYLDALSSENVAPLVMLPLPVEPLYGPHWSTSGVGVPDYDAPDSQVYLPGRNVLLIGLTAVWCSVNGISKIAIGSLDENPFPDATPAFFNDYARLLSEALSHEIEVIAPYRGRHKADIIRDNPSLPLALTLTCMSPRVVNGELAHCGACNKCAERQRAFAEAGVRDETLYAR